MIRLDVALVEVGLAPSRSKAQQLIANGDVEIFREGDWREIRQASYIVQLDPQSVLRVKEGAEILKYVSRGGLKMEGALKHLGWDPRGWRVLDLGLSTGGFADCLLASGAGAVCGIDVGHGQLHAKLKVEKRLLSLEGLHIKNAHANEQVQDWLREGVDLCVADLSFISLVSLFPVIANLLPADTHFLGLIKPQFELGADHLNKAGVIKDDTLFTGLEREVHTALKTAGFTGRGFFPSQLKGQDGNQEFFVEAFRNER